MNVLSDPLFTVQCPSGIRQVSLSELLALLFVTNEPQGFPRLAADQRSYWWRFLVRCAARAVQTMEGGMEQVRSLEPETACDRIANALRQHASGGSWLLHNPDLAEAGFLQSPLVGAATLKKAKYRENSAAILTAVIGTKEHERKTESGRCLDGESLSYALIEYQSGVIFGGRGNYESQLTGSRSGAGSGTPFMGVLIDQSLGRTFRHDVRTLLSRWADIKRIAQGSIWALWREPWDGTQTLPFRSLDPAFIPYARMIRVGPPQNDMFDTVWFRSSKVSRVDTVDTGGNVGDIFVPLVPDPKEGHLKVRGTLASGYGYKEVVKLLLPRSGEEAVRSATVEELLANPGESTDLRVIFEGMAFEQGKTRGFHKRIVRLPRRAVRTGLLRQRTEPLDAAHQQMLEATKQAKRTLRSALGILLGGEPRVRDGDAEKIAIATSEVEERVDRRYLGFLFTAVQDSQAEDATYSYRRWLHDMIRNEVFPRAIRSLPGSVGRQWQKEVRAEAYLRNKLRERLGLTSEPKQERTA